MPFVLKKTDSKNLGDDCIDLILKHKRQDSDATSSKLYQSRKFKFDILVNGMSGKVREVLEMIESSE